MRSIASHEDMFYWLDVSRCVCLLVLDLLLSVTPSGFSTAVGGSAELVFMQTLPEESLSKSLEPVYQSNTREWHNLVPGFAGCWAYTAPSPDILAGNGSTCWQTTLHAARPSCQMLAAELCSQL